MEALPSPSSLFPPSSLARLSFSTPPAPPCTCLASSPLLAPGLGLFLPSPSPGLPQEARELLVPVRKLVSPSEGPKALEGGVGRARIRGQVGSWSSPTEHIPVHLTPLAQSLLAVVVGGPSVSASSSTVSTPTASTIPTRSPKEKEKDARNRPNMSQLTDEGNVVVGRGKSGWNKLLSSPKSGSSGGSSRERLLADDPASASSIPSGTTAPTGKSPTSGAIALAAAVSGSSPSPSSSHSAPPSAPPKPSTPAPQPSQSHHSRSTHTEEEPLPLNGDDDDEEEEEEDDPHGMFHGAGKFLLAGGIAGAVSRTATAPFDRLKVYLITSQDRPVPSALSSSSASSKSIPKEGRKEKGGRRSAGRLPAAARALWKQGGGMRAFWTGNGLNVVKIFPESAIKFLSYESAKRVFAQYWDKVPDQTMISNSSRFVAGGIGGVVSQFVIYPIETLKTRVMSSTGGTLSGNALILSTLRSMFHTGGIPLFFRGLPAGLIGVFPYSAIDMSTYEGIKIAYAKWTGVEAEFPGTLVFGAVSGGIGATSVYPLNLVRTRLQAQGTPAHPQIYTGVQDAAMQCFRREGWRGFYKGLTPTLVKVIPAVSISYAVYDKAKKVLFALDAPEHVPGAKDEVDDC